MKIEIDDALIEEYKVQFEKACKATRRILDMCATMPTDSGKIRELMKAVCDSHEATDACSKVMLRIATKVDHEVGVDRTDYDAMKRECELLIALRGGQKVAYKGNA